VIVDRVSNHKLTSDKTMTHHNPEYGAVFNGGVRTAEGDNTMTANTLREIVSSVLKIKAQDIILCDTIAPDKSFTGNSCWSSQTTQRRYYIYGYSTSRGLINLNDHVGHLSNDNSGKTHGDVGTPLCDIPEIETFDYLIVEEEITCEGNLNGLEDSVRIYKLPDFSEHREKSEEKDIERWKNWIANKPKNKMKIVGYSIGYHNGEEATISNHHDTSGTFRDCLAILLASGAYSLLDCDTVYYIDLHLLTDNGMKTISVNIDHPNKNRGEQ
jgi:hypothetical protein